MRQSSTAARTVIVALFFVFQGCGGCSGPGKAPEPPPKPVQGNAPQAAAPAAVATVPVAEMKDACALLVFSSVETGAAPLNTQLTAEGDCTKGTARFEWDFGDGTPGATGDTVVHTFEKPGTFTVKGKITSDELPGAEDVDTVEILVTAPQS